MVIYIYMSQNSNIFDRKFYITAYKDVNPKFTDPKKHYMKVGLIEDRLPNAQKFKELYPLFNINVYAHMNEDLCHLPPEELMSHFHHFGRFEFRVYKN